MAESFPGIPAPGGRGDAALNLWSEQARHQMECSLQTFGALLRGSEEMGQAQIDAVQQALEHHRELQHRLQQAEDLPQLMELQSELWRFEAAVAGRYWHDLMDAALRMNAEMMRSQMDLLGSAAEAQRSAPQAVQSVMGGGVRPRDTLYNIPVPNTVSPHKGSRHHH